MLKRNRLKKKDYRNLITKYGKFMPLALYRGTGNMEYLKYLEKMDDQFRTPKDFKLIFKMKNKHVALFVPKVHICFQHLDQHEKEGLFKLAEVDRQHDYNYAITLTVPWPIDTELGIRYPVRSLQRLFSSYQSGIQDHRYLGMWREEAIQRTTTILQATLHLPEWLIRWRA